MIYLDNNATTSLDPDVLAAMEPFMRGFVGNPSSIHRFGQKAKGRLTEALKVCAHFLKVSPDEIIYTSGATEAFNFLIRTQPHGAHVITSSLEHLAVLEPLKLCGCYVTYLDPEPGKGAISAAQVRGALQENTRMIVLTAANNETGVKSDIAEIARVASERGIPFVVDGVALLGKEPFLIPEGVSAVCFSGHKIHAPLGVGVAVVRKTFKTSPFIVGGPQQRGLRAGTENLPAIIGFTKALELLHTHGGNWAKQMGALRDRFERELLASLPDIVIHGKEELRICNTSNVAFPGVDGETLLMTLDLAGLAASHGSACSSGTLESSRVLLNMGIDRKIVRSSLRFSLSRFTTEAEIDQSIALITEAVTRLRSLL